ncbi:site-specific DNA-methyltransferase, partial [Arthrobacter sp. zg-Y769]|nr:site-specific DNA-methyltransferase [Arthrobacter sp. zg-Y769]
FSKWRLSSDVEPGAFEQRLLDLRESSSADGASADDLLTELLLKQGYSLTEQVNPVEIAGLELRSVAGGLVLAYLDEHVKPSLEQLRAVVEADPQRLIVLEDAFQGDDELKTNLAQLCKGRGVELWTA